MSARASTLTLLRAEKWHRGGDLQAAHRLVQHCERESVADVTWKHRMGTRSLLCPSPGVEGQGGGLVGYRQAYAAARRRRGRGSAIHSPMCMQFIT